MNISNYMKKEGRTLPVFLLVDVSGSMSGQKIETVNVALKEMLNAFRKIENPKGIIKLGLITFGGNRAEVVKPLSTIGESDSFVFNASGNTPMGMAFRKAYELIEDKTVVSSRDYTPTIVLISDGNPTDFNYSGKSAEQLLEWPELKELHNGPRSSKAVRLSMGIGSDVDLNILKAFNNSENPVISAKDNTTIGKFFQWVTMSVSTRSISANPNEVKLADTSVFNDDEVEF